MRHRRFAVAAAALLLLAAVGLRGSGPAEGPAEVMVADRPLAPIDPAIDPGKPLRLVAFGTSLTAANPWPDQLAARLSACLDRPVILTRVARSGATSAWALAEHTRVVAAVPDIVLLEFATNDADILDGLALARSRRNHAALLDALAAAAPQAQVVLMTMNPVVGPLRRLQRPRLPDYFAMLRDLAGQRHLAMADLAPRWQVAMAADPGLEPTDGLHPAGSATARIVLPVLAGQIGAAAGRSC